jgi:hypothetical protein
MSATTAREIRVATRNAMRSFSYETRARRTHSAARPFSPETNPLSTRSPNSRKTETTSFGRMVEARKSALNRRRPIRICSRICDSYRIEFQLSCFVRKTHLIGG